MKCETSAAKTRPAGSGASLERRAAGGGRHRDSLSARRGRAPFPRRACRTRVLGIVCHGDGAPWAPPGVPLARIAMAQLGAEPLIEDSGPRTSRSRPARAATSPGRAAPTSCSGSFRQAAPGGSLEADTCRAYRELFALLEAQSSAKLLRISELLPRHQRRRGGRAGALQAFLHRPP